MSLGRRRGWRAEDSGLEVLGSRTKSDSLGRGPGGYPGSGECSKVGERGLGFGGTLRLWGCLRSGEGSLGGCGGRLWAGKGGCRGCLGTRVAPMSGGHFEPGGRGPGGYSGLRGRLGLGESRSSVVKDILVDVVVVSGRWWGGPRSVARAAGGSIFVCPAYEVGALVAQVGVVLVEEGCGAVASRADGCQFGDALSSKKERVS